MLQKAFMRRPSPNPEVSEFNDIAPGTKPTIVVASTSSLPEQFIGLWVMHEPKMGTEIVNIVFVHGLGGSARETWTHYPSKIF